jgi:hypothetical protein
MGDDAAAEDARVVAQQILRLRGEIVDQTELDEEQVQAIEAAAERAHIARISRLQNDAEQSLANVLRSVLFALVPPTALFMLGIVLSWVLWGFARETRKN